MPLRLRIVSEQQRQLGEAHEHEFRACGGTIGRAPDNDWVLTDEKRYISSRHALIDFQGGAYYLVDTSRNGVFVNDADTAVGRGHPQRLFDGDWLRLGQYTIAVEITGTDTEGEDDGMRDSVVRAQLVPIDDSIELQLLDDGSGCRKKTTPAPAPAPAPAPEQQTAQPPAPAPGITTAGSAAPTSLSMPGTAEAAALEIFCRAAGLTPADLGNTNPERALETAGSMMRSMVMGLSDLVRAQDSIKDALCRAPAGARIAERRRAWNPPQPSAALKALLEDADHPDLSPEQALQGAFLEVKARQHASMRAVMQGMQNFIERFDPAELRNLFDRGLKRSSLLASANKLKYWELYQDYYLTLSRQDEGAMLPGLLIDDLVRAYDEEISRATPPTVIQTARKS